MRLVVVGDVMLSRMVGVTMSKRKDYVFPFRKIMDEFSEADLVAINLESPIFEPCPLTQTGMKFCADKRIVEGLLELGVGMVGVANNHIRNYGDKGYEMTVEVLRRVGIEISSEENLVIVEKDDVTYGFWAIDLVSSRYTNKWLEEKVKKMSEEVEVLVVMVHWGNEYKAIESENQRVWGRLMVDAGADLVVGHHPHVVQPIEVYKGVPIVYSLGNFVFDQMWSVETREGVIGEFVFDGVKLKEMNFWPIFINKDYQPELVLDQQQKEKIMKRLGSYSL
jgi:poly-gamma-glutamate synthesis protein (capsule biosynthesis protein)